MILSTDEFKNSNPPATPALWGEPPPPHFDVRIPCWTKFLLILVAIVVSIFLLDARIALWARQHPIPDLGYRAGAMNASNTSVPTPTGGDAGRELMWLEQWGQGVCATVVVIAIFLVDKAGRRRALSVAIACLLTLLATHLLKDLVGRSRPFIGLPNGWGAGGGSRWGGPAVGFTGGAAWTSFPSAHTSAAFALASAFSWFYPRARGLFMALAICTAAQRVWHDAHYLSDVIAGMTLGILVSRWSLKTKLAGRIIALSPPNAARWWLADWP